MARSHKKRTIVLDPRDPMGCAKILVREYLTHDDGLRIIQRYRALFYWFDGSCYRTAQEGEVRQAVWEFLDGENRVEVGEDGREKVVPFRPNSASVSNVCDALAAVCEAPNGMELPTWLPGVSSPGSDLPAEEFLAVKNGLLHVPTGMIYPLTPGYFGLNASDIEFEPSATSPMWDAFLDNVFGSDSESRNAVQEWFGYVLTPDTSQHKAMFLVGPPRGGKGIISRTLRSLIGPRNVSSPTLSSLQGEFGMQPLIGKLLAIISDARIGRRTDPATVAERLLSITGQDAVSANRKNLSFWEGQLATRFMIISNELPHFTDSSTALIKRMIVIQLTQSWLGKEDTGLERRLQSEMSGILNYAIEGYRRLNERGHFEQPSSAMDAIQAMEDLASPVRAFVRDCCIVGSDQTAEVAALFDRWERWCDAHGQRYTGTVQQFGRQLRAAFPNIRMVQHPRRYTGIAIDAARSKARAERTSDVRLVSKSG